MSGRYTISISKTALGLTAAAIIGTVFVSYCIYFDRKQKTHEKMKNKHCTKKTNNMPDMTNHEAIQAFFHEEIKLGENLLGQGEIDRGIEHLCNAVTICVQPAQMLEILQQALPPQLFLILLQRLPNHSQAIMEIEGMIPRRVNE